MTDRNRTTRLGDALPAHTIPTDEEIERLVLHDTVVQATMALWKEGRISWDEAKRLMIAGLVKTNAALRDELDKAGREAPPPVVIAANAGHRRDCGLVTGKMIRCTCGYLVTQDDLRRRI
jgi:hypothetical protein